MRGNRVLLMGLVLSLAAAIFFGIRWQLAEQRAARAEHLSLQPAHPRVYLEDFEITRMKKLGLDDPVAALRSDLSAQEDLIQFESGVGGEMRFYDKAGMILLPGRYVYAPAEDGHYLIHAVLRYEVGLGGKIGWKVLDSHMDD